MHSHDARRLFTVSADGSVVVEVVVALPGRQSIFTVELEPGATVVDALDRSGVRQDFPEIDIDGCEVAVWGRLSDRSSPVRDGDRVEVLRPLAQDPRDARRALASQGGFMGGSPRK